MNRKICIGIVAQVDAGKTTLCESMLFLSDFIRKKGRVEDCNTFFDYNLSEKKHGITLYSKEANIQWKDVDLTIIDTPGHRDFKSEVDRIIPILDVLLFVVNSSELHKPQNKFLFQQIQKCEKPIILFVSKMDMNRITTAEAASVLSDFYSEKCIPFLNDSFYGESSATIDETFFSAYIEGKNVSAEHTKQTILRGAAYPVLFGSGLSGDGVEELLNLIAGIAVFPAAISNAVSKCAYVYRIDRDAKGLRQTHVKILAGEYIVREEISYKLHGKRSNEKINEIRQINGSRFVSLTKAGIGDIVAFVGLSHPVAGQYLDNEIMLSKGYTPSANPIEYALYCDKTVSENLFFDAMRQLEDEDPSFSISATGINKCVLVHLKGDLQKDILLEILDKRFRIPAHFGDPQVQYYETISNETFGNGHYEPLKHYAEVRIKLSPLPRGSGIVYESKCPEDVLTSNWQNIILNSIRSFQIRGVLIGAPLTDVKITLLSGKYHLKHTEGGDFREAVIRAIRQGLMKASSLLLEPNASFVILCPSGMTGRILSDLEQERITVTHQSCAEEGLIKLQGKGSLLTVDQLRKKYLISYGDSVFFEYTDNGLYPSNDTDKVITERQYSPQSDLEQSPDSVFCFHGAGHIVKWNEADAFMHTPSVEVCEAKTSARYSISEKEFNEILRKYSLLENTPSVYHRREEVISQKNVSFKALPSVYLIDGSNLLYAYSLQFASEKHENTSQVSLFQVQLISDLINYILFTGAFAKIVFDGFNIASQNTDTCMITDKLTVLYSGNESADVLLERLAASIGPDYKCKMVTSDQMVQISALHSGIIRVSSREFLKEMAAGLSKMRENIEGKNQSISSTIGDNVYRIF